MDESKTLAKKTYMSMTNVSKDTSHEEEVNFTQLYRKNADPVFYYLYSRLGNVADAEDLTSRTFLTAFENLSKLRDPLKFRSWVFTIARNKVNDFFRKSQRHPIEDYDEEIERVKTQGRVLSPADEDRLSVLESLVTNLSPLEQEYLRLRIVAELPFAEIASILNEPETRIKKKYYRLLERLQAQVEK